jgi:hypothetical protein
MYHYESSWSMKQRSHAETEEEKYVRRTRTPAGKQELRAAQEDREVGELRLRTTAMGAGHSHSHSYQGEQRSRGAALLNNNNFHI